jgi:hypothetical protein
MNAFLNNRSVDTGAVVAPGIRIVREADGYRLAQNRPPMGPVLASLSLEQALEQITMLLPICGEAQRIAARRAVDAARGATGPFSDEIDATLLREQLQSAIWRLVVDWPGLIDEPQNLQVLRHALRSRDPAELRLGLREQLDGLDQAESPAAVRAWVERADCTAARVTSRALDLERDSPDWPEPEALDPRSVIERSRTPGFWPEADAPLAPPAGEIGARAMSRHPLAHEAGLPGGSLAGRLLAQALDAAFLLTADPASAVIGEDVPDGSAAGSGAGIGWAMTARGPLLHRVVLHAADADRARRWDVLAPTDWHFGPEGPVAQALASLDGTMDEEYARFLVAGFDPCAAWSVVDAEEEG